MILKTMIIVLMLMMNSILQIYHSLPVYHHARSKWKCKSHENDEEIEFVSEHKKLFFRVGASTPAPPPWKQKKWQIVNRLTANTTRPDE